MGDRHGGRFARRGRALSLHRCGFPTARCGGRDLPARERSPRRRPLDTAHRRKNLPRAETLSSAKASRHGARAKGFAPQGNALLGEGFPTRRTGERVCPAQERSPRRRPPGTAHGRKDLPAQERSPRRKPPDTAQGRRDLPAQEHSHGEGLPTRRTSERICPAGVRPRPTC